MLRPYCLGAPTYPPDSINCLGGPTYPTSITRSFGYGVSECTAPWSSM